MIEDDNKTLWCGNLPEQVTEELLYELFLQAGPLEKVRIARDRDGRQRNFAFITYRHDISVPYAINLFRGTALFHRTLSLQCRARMALLPPPIRCYGPDLTPDFVQMNSSVTQQFAQMTEQLKENEPKPVRTQRQLNDELVLDSLQGKWNHGHHPYNSKDKSLSIRDEFRKRDSHSGSSRSKHSGSWRDRRSYKKVNYHRRD